MILFLLASGLSLIFGALRVINFTHGSFYMISAYLAYAVVTALADYPAVGFWVALVVAPIATGIFGGLVEYAFFRRVYARELEYQLLLTYGLVLVFSDVVRFIWGEEYRSLSRPAVLGGPVFVFGKPVPVYIIFLIVVAALIGVGLWLLLYRTKLGKTIRAVVYDRHMVSALGINVPRMYSLVFGLGCWLAGLAGGLMAPMGSITLGMDVEIIVECFVVVVVGGMGSILGALLGALLMGELYAFGILIFPRVALASLFLAMTVVLVIRPWGLLGKPEKERA
ncbi:MAG: branched-chain amino acid ABC transporter permease [Candidatus Rokuibacteriota bacterium]|nr:MAG: branched-chain amino acid ABC transporter permease [Candidatus Rokubacteria bacterium]